MFTLKFVCSGVCLYRYAMTISAPASRLISSTMRTSAVLSSRTSVSGASFRSRTRSPIFATRLALFTV